MIMHQGLGRRIAIRYSLDRPALNSIITVNLTPRIGHEEPQCKSHPSRPASKFPNLLGALHRSGLIRNGRGQVTIMLSVAFHAQSHATAGKARSLMVL
jgi:hypothetical protein